MKPIGRITRLSIHCTDTREGVPFTVQQIRAMHTAKPPLGRGWEDIGYHFVIGLKGEEGLGRSLQFEPAAVQGYNHGMIAVAYVGGMDRTGAAKDTRTAAQKKALASLVRHLASKYGLPASAIGGHRDWDYIDFNHDKKPEPNEWKKLCPAFEVSLERDGWLKGLV